MSLTGNYITLSPQITLIKDVYKRHTNIQKVKKHFKTTNNNFKFIAEQDNMYVINNIWISKKNLKNIAFVICKNSVDANLITYKSLSEPNDDIQIIHKIDIDALVVLNKIVDNQNKKYLRLPCNDNPFIPQLIDQNMYYLIVCDPIDKINNNLFDIYSSYVYLHDQTEINKFNALTHEYLIKRYETIEYETSIQNTKVELKSNIGCALLIIQCNKSLKNITCNIKHANDIVRSYNLSIDDPEFVKLSENNDLNTFIIDPFSNVLLEKKQPQGLLEIMPESHIELDDAYKIKITYVLYDVFLIKNGLAGLLKQIPLQVIEEPIIIQPIIDNNNNNNNNNNNDNNNDNVIDHYTKLIHMYTNTYAKFFVQFSKFATIFIMNCYEIIEIIGAINQKLPSDDNICVVSLEEIKYGDYYYNCEQCNKVFEKKTYHNCIIYHKNYTFNCPNCRKTTNNFPSLKKNYDFFGLKYGNIKMFFGICILFGFYCFTSWNMYIIRILLFYISITSIKSITNKL